MSIANENTKKAVEDNQKIETNTSQSPRLHSRLYSDLEDLSKNLSTTLQLIPSLSYFVNKNQSDSATKSQSEEELTNKIETHLNNLEKFNKKNNKKLRIMDQQQTKEEQEVQESAVQDSEEQTNGIKKSKSVLRKFNRGNLIRQLTHESEKAASATASDNEIEDDETKKNTLLNTKIMNHKFTHLFFFKSDCALASLSKQLVKNFNNFEFNDEPVNTNMTTDDDLDNQNQSTDRSDVSQSEPDDDENQRSHSASVDDGDEDQATTNRPSRSRKRKSKKHIKSTRIVRIDLSEVDVRFDDPKTAATKIDYLDDLFKENSINKFYAFKRTTNLSSLYLATNIAVSISSVDSESASEGSRDIASIHFSGEEVSNIRRNSAAQNQSVLSNKNFVKSINDCKKETIEESNIENKNSIKKKFAAIKQATFDKIRSRSNSKKKKRAKSENDKQDEAAYNHIDLRDYGEEKKKDLNDSQLDLFLESRIVCTRRNAITARIDRYYRGAELITYMENLLRQEYIENFLL